MSLPDPSNVLRLEGEIDLYVSPEIAAVIKGMTALRPPRLVVDLSAVTYIDSSGLSVLINGVNDVEEYGGRLMLSGVQEHVRTIIDAAGLSGFFVSFAHVDAALAAV